MKQKRNKKTRSGSIYILAVTMVLILSLLGIGLLRLGQNARLQAVKDVLQMSARAAADAGIEHAVRHMMDIWNATGDIADKNNWVNSTWFSATPGTDIGYSFPDNPADTVTLDDTYGNARFRYDIYKGTQGDGYRIISTGTAGGVTRTVNAAMMLKSSFFGIGAKRSIYLSPNTELGTVPDGGTMVIQTNEDDPGIITLKSGITVPGDVVSGPGSDPDIAIALAKNSNIEGEVRASEDYIDFPPVYIPDELSILPYGTVTIDSSDDSIAYITGNIKLASLEFGSGSLKTVETLYIQGDVDIFVDGETYINSNSRIVVTDGSSLDLYLGGDLNSKPGAEITYSNIAETANPSDAFIIEAASSIRIKGTVAADGTPLCNEIHFYPKDDFYGTVYAPDADPLYLAPNGDFCGSIVGSNNITIKPGGTYMYIPSLVETVSVEVMYMGIKHGSWWE